MLKQKALQARSICFIGNRFVILLVLVVVAATPMLSRLQGQTQGQNQAQNPAQNQAQDSTGSLQWLEPGQKDFGIISKRRGWHSLEQQDCTRPQNSEAGDAKQICGEQPSAKYVQEYLLKFSYLPDNNDTRFPFGVPLEFQLRIDQVQESEQYFWLVALSNRSEGSIIPFYQKKLQAQTKAPTEAGSSKSAQRALKRKLKKELRKLQKEQVQEAQRFLKGYFTCLRKNREC